MYYQCEDIRVSVEALIRSEAGQKDSWRRSSRDIGLRKAEVSYHCFWLRASEDRYCSQKDPELFQYGDD